MSKDICIVVEKVNEGIKCACKNSNYANNDNRRRSRSYMAHCAIYDVLSKLTLSEVKLDKNKIGSKSIFNHIN